MPYYRNRDAFKRKKDCPAFEHCREPGETAPYTGIYRCVTCDWEIVAKANDPLPIEVTCVGHLSPEGPTPRGTPHSVAWKLEAAVIQEP
jgi:hypothetical protein